jgi:hypothetical protein
MIDEVVCILTTSKGLTHERQDAILWHSNDFEIVLGRDDELFFIHFLLVIAWKSLLGWC